jgi:hypothetical protein
MTQKLALPYFIKHDILANPQERRSIQELAEASVQLGDPLTGRQVSGDNNEAAIAQALEGLKSLNIPEETIQQVVKSLVEKTVTDPVVLLQPYAQPADFAAQYPQPLDPTEILTLCEEIMVWQTLPEVVTPTNADSWREMDELAFTGDGLTNEGFFLKGSCPDTYTHDGDNQSITRMYLGAQKTLSYEDIKHSLAVAAIEGLGISAISTQQRRAAVADVKAKEMLLQEILVLNKWDKALVKGNSTTNTLAFDGIETQVTSAGGARINADPTGQFDIEDFDNFLNAGCARATHVFGHPKALEAIKKGYLSLGATGGTQPIMQILVTKDGNQIVPGFILADMIDTSIGRIMLVPDFRFTVIQVQPDRFHATVYPLRVYHNGEPIVYKSTQTPLSFKDLTPGCTSISFMIYAVTALVIKHMCAQSAFTANFPGVVGTGCDVICES